ncbi:hypothetical protein HF1_03580 [Mycoplasma haemofelis str. Langford 1]|uniref:Uncharacterized protein n=1 Tax=Mycoplasma haemofelis (strain Langford 1) TaxID=941640 RepID=E8ZGU5_MYCHL|nr:hypothetical protein [Mycoplasma haemofelis]CBY92366.1 hypothetical protein HF1_03580 [Mycoplasma haemofelis str. Langford 1]
MLSSLGAASGIAGGAAVYSQIGKEDNSKSLREHIDTKRRVILNTDNSDHDGVWKQLVSEYKASNSAIKGIDKEAVDESRLKNYCKTSQGKKSKEVSLMREYTQWCSRNSIREQITTLSTGKKNWILEGDTSTWDTKKESYKTIQTNDPTLEGVEKTNPDTSKMISACNKLALIPYINTDDNNYKLVDKWCVKD